jgi:hypothetical protein
VKEVLEAPTLFLQEVRTWFPFTKSYFQKEDGRSSEIEGEKMDHGLNITTSNPKQ